MKILCNFTPCGPAFVRSGWGRVFSALGHDFRFWRADQQAAFDVFSEFEPDVYLGTTYELDRAILKCVAARPHMKVALYASAWGPYLNDVDLAKYPLVVAAEQEKKNVELLADRISFVFIHAHGPWLEGTMSGWGSLGLPYKGVLNAADTFVYLNGKKQKRLACDVGFVGGYWGYKARNIDKYLLPLCHPSSGLDVKIFGNAAWPVANWLGGCTDEEARDLFASATVCPNISEPHSTDLGWDVIERPFKVLSAGGFCISDYVPEGRDLFTEDELPMAQTPAKLAEWVRWFIKNPEAREAYRQRGQRKVLADHTYFDRVYDMLDWLGYQGEAARCLALKGKLLGGQL